MVSGSYLLPQHSQSALWKQEKINRLHMPYFDQFYSIQQAGFTMPTGYQLMLVMGNLSGVNFYSYFTVL